MCQVCMSRWRNGIGLWKDNVLTCCGREIRPKPHENPCDIDFYCTTCYKPRRTCVDCNEMLHTNEMFWHGICSPCFIAANDRCFESIKAGEFLNAAIILTQFGVTIYELLWIWQWVAPSILYLSEARLIRRLEKIRASVAK
jgi:hypothetical protein